MEHFNSLYFSDYPGSEFPHSCSQNFGYGGYGDYGIYGEGCQGGKKSCGMEGAHEPGCMCPMCQAPYSMPYKADQSACGNPMCQCQACDGNCKCGAMHKAMPMAAPMMEDHDFELLGTDMMDWVKYIVMAIVAYFVFRFVLKVIR